MRVQIVSERRFVLALLVGAVLTRLTALLLPLKPDEAGYLLVAQSWSTAGDSLYGQYWVDRPPGLILVHRLGDALAGPYGPRIIVAALAVAAVMASYRVGVLLADAAWGRWTGILALGLFSVPQLDVWATKSESVGVPLVMISCWLTIEALQAGPGARRLGLSLGSGVAGALAMTMKQNLGGAAVFGLVLLVALLVTRRLSGRDARGLAGAAVVGFGLPVAAVLVWAGVAGIDLGTLWNTLFGFRGAALDVIGQDSVAAPVRRAGVMVLLFLVTGMAAAIGWFTLHLRGLLALRPEVPLAVAALIGFDALGIILSGSFWQSNLQAMIPGAVLAAAVSGSLLERRRIGGRVVMGSALVCAALVVLFVGARVTSVLTPDPYYAGRAVAKVADPDDSILTLYGRSDVSWASGLDAPYEYLWNLPMRVRDPELAQMRGLLTGPTPPTWVVVASPGGVDSWDIDESGRLKAILAADYVEHGEVCDRRILLHRSVERADLPTVDCSDLWLFSDLR